MEDYLTQGEILKGRFLEKKYPADLVEHEFVGAASKDRQELFLPRPRQNREEAPLFITQYGHRSNKFVEILKKNWEVLKLDPVLSTILPAQPKVVYRRAPTSSQQGGKKLH